MSSKSGSSTKSRRPNSATKTRRNSPRKRTTIASRLEQSLNSNVIGYISKFLPKEEKIVLGKTLWHDFPLHFSYEYRWDTYSHRDADGDLLEPTYPLTHEEGYSVHLHKSNVKDKLEKCVKEHIKKVLRRKKNRHLDLLPSDIEKVRIKLVFGTAVDKKRREAQYISRPPHQWRDDDEILHLLVNNQIKGHNYYVEFEEIEIVPKNGKEFPRMDKPNCGSSGLSIVKLYAHREDFADKSYTPPSDYT